MERSLYLIISYCSLISATLFDIEVEVDYGTWDLSFSTQQATFEGSIYNCNAEGGILAVLPSSEATIEATEQIKDHINDGNDFENFYVGLKRDVGTFEINDFVWINGSTYNRNDSFPVKSGGNESDINCMILSKDQNDIVATPVTCDVLRNYICLKGKPAIPNWTWVVSGMALLLSAVICFLLLKMRTNKRLKEWNKYLEQNNAAFNYCEPQQSNYVYPQPSQPNNEYYHAANANCIIS